MVVIGFVLLGVGLVVGVLLALADPVMLSRINGEPAEGASGRHINVPPRGADAEVVYVVEELAPIRLPRRGAAEQSAPKAA
ncbi:hypothetical protein [Nonomuraea typhae]|uniref:hypothetical protein n=1 Tax=Nonomuraea typhae TaxID=2603600 RepID=UPI0012F839A2|nr:hypothetical protein [Nonomuraea typhae]